MIFAPTKVGAISLILHEYLRECSKREMCQNAARKVCVMQIDSRDTAIFIGCIIIYTFICIAATAI